MSVVGPRLASSTCGSAPEEAEAGLWPCRLLRSLGQRWHAIEQPLLKVSRLEIRGAPSSKYDKKGCHPYLVVRHPCLVPRESFDETVRPMADTWRSNGL